MNSQLDVRRTIVTLSAVLILISVAILTWRVITLELGEQRDRENIDELIQHEHAEFGMIQDALRFSRENHETLDQMRVLHEANAALHRENHDLMLENNRLLTENSDLLKQQRRP